LPETQPENPEIQVRDQLVAERLSVTFDAPETGHVEPS
jgi:hypothetical protein